LDLPGCKNERGKEVGVRIVLEDKKLLVETPYHPKFPLAAKQLGGTWNGAQRAWFFDARDEERVRELCLRIYGEDGREYDRVTVRFSVPASNLGLQTYWRFGRQIAHRPSRDAEVRLGESVILLKGEFHSSGGSAKYPLLVGRYTDEVLVFEARDVPRPAVEGDKGTYEIIDEMPTESLTVTVMGEVLELLRALQEADDTTPDEVIRTALNVYDAVRREE